MKTCRANLRVGVGFTAKQLGILPGWPRSARKFFGDDASTLIVIGNDLRFRDAGNLDLTVDQEDRDTFFRGATDG